MTEQQTDRGLAAPAAVVTPGSAAANRPACSVSFDATFCCYERQVQLTILSFLAHVLHCNSVSGFQFGR